MFCFLIHFRYDQGDETVYFLDYIGPRGFARSVANYSKEVIVLDHHKTAVEELAGAVPLPRNMKAHLDMNKSGATIAQDYFGIDVVNYPCCVPNFVIVSWLAMLIVEPAH